MKMKFLLLGMVALLATGGLWFGHAAWRAHRQLVTLNVREMPLAEVLRKIEWQTWTKIRAEKSLADQHITLRVTNKPLADVLDRLAGQVGAHWSTVFAVYDSSRALKKLDAVLSGDGHFKPAGWTKIAPTPPDTKPVDADGAVPPQGQGHFMVFNQINGQTIITESGNGQTEIWSPRELVIESKLAAQADRGQSPGASAEVAAETAKKVNGRWTTCLWFQKSAIGIIGTGMGFRGSPGQPVTRLAQGHDYASGGSSMTSGSGQTNFGQNELSSVPPPASNPNNRFATFTPEQRVRLAREKMQVGGRLKIQRRVSESEPNILYP